MTAVKTRLAPSRIVLQRDGEQWVAVRLTTKGEEIERSPAGSFGDADQYRRNFHRYGAWLKS